MGNVFKLVPFLKPYWRRAVVALLLLSTLVFLDLSIPRLIQRLIDQGITAGNQQVVVRTSLLMLGISALSAVIAIGNNVTSVRVGESFARDLREAQFLKIQSLSYGNLDQLKTGQLIVRLTSDTAALQRLVQVSLRIGTRAPLMMIGSLILMFRTDSRLAFTLLPLLFFTMIVVVFFMVRMEPMFLKVQQRLDRLNTVLQENIAGAEVIKAFARADFENARFEVANEDVAAQSVRAMRFMAVMSPALTTLVNIGMVLVIWRGGLQAIGGDLTSGQIVAFTNYLLTTMGPLTMLAMLSTVWAYGIASAGRVNQVLDAVPEVLDAPDARDLSEDAAGQITFDHVSFRYDGADVMAGESEVTPRSEVLEDISLTVEPGQTVAILGATGAGKSTLINLAPRFYDVDTGRVLIDGIDVRAFRQDSLLSAIGVVPQESILFSGTVRENIRYGRPEASDAEVVAAAMAAQAHDFILELPNGYDTRLEERAVNLSGGQKQRIAIARALLLKPKILILDDSTSAVDVETETKIQDALAQTDGSATKLVVAQRISTVLNADKIVVIDRGRIVAEGTHSELMQASPIYKEIYDSQLGEGPGEAFDFDAPAVAQSGDAL